MKWTMEALVQVHERGVPLLGICFGHQMLGQALGGRVESNPNGREIGTFPLTRVATDPLLDEIDAPPIVVTTHLDSIVELPPGAHVVGTTPLEAHAAVRFSPTTWGVQFHPEMDAEIVGYYLNERRDLIEKEGIDVQGLLDGRRDSAFGAKLLAKFAAFCGNGARFDVE